MLFTQSTVLTAIFAIIGYVSASPAPTALSVDDVILLDGSGNSHVMKASEFAALERRDAAAAASAASDALAPAVNVPRSGVPRGDCEQSTEVQVLSDVEKLYPDVAISAVMSAQNLSLSYVSVSSGYSLSNSLSVTESSALTLLEDVLTVTLSVTYTTTWTTSEDQTLTFYIPHNMFGVIVSQPYAREIKGNVYSGCTDSPTVTGFTSATYYSETYKNLSWVRGIVRLCTNETYPVPYCSGEGFHQ